MIKMSKNPQDTVKVVLVGDTNVGKTCMVVRGLEGYFNDKTEATLGAAFATSNVTVNGHELHMQFWDTAGQEKFRGLAPMYYRDAKVVIIVYAINIRSSFDSINVWADLIRENGDGNEIVFLIGNKSDLEDRVITTEEGRERAEKMNAIFMETSAKKGNGISDLFELISFKYEERIRDSNVETKDPPSCQLDSKEEPKKNCC